MKGNTPPLPIVCRWNGEGCVVIPKYSRKKPMTVSVRVSIATELQPPQCRFVGRF
jgi:hypothetical protein